MKLRAKLPLVSHNADGGLRAGHRFRGATSLLRALCLGFERIVTFAIALCSCSLVHAKRCPFARRKTANVRHKYFAISRLYAGARCESRTHTPSPERDFKPTKSPYPISIRQRDFPLYAPEIDRLSLERDRPCIAETTKQPALWRPLAGPWISAGTRALRWPRSNSPRLLSMRR